MVGRRVRLTCPIQFCRIQTAAVGKHCRHLQCFDLEAYIRTTKLQSNFEQRWQCPTCTRRILPADISLDPLVQAILQDEIWIQNGRRPSDDDEVCFDADGKWTVVSQASPQADSPVPDESAK